MASAGIAVLKSAMSNVPQAEVHTDHYFADGMYARVVFRNAGILVVGKVHKREHLYIVTKGSVAVTNGDGPAKVYEAGSVIVSPPGTERAVLALEDSICMTVHRTNLTDLDEIEEELIESDDLALFNSSNQLKALT